MASIAPEVLIYDLLSGGLTAFKADQSLLGDLFSTLTAAEQKEIREFFSNENITVRIGKPPRGPDYKVPMVVIETVNEDELPDQDLLGDFMEAGEDDFSASETHGVRLRGTYNIVYIGKDNRQARILYRTGVALLIVFRYQLEQAGFQNRRMTGNKDVVVDLGADPLEAKLMTLTGEYWFSIKTSERLQNCIIQTAVAAEAGSQLEII